jgi:hypothetical protein
MRKLLIGAVFIAAMLFDLRPAPASEDVAPWCAVVSLGWGDAYWDCRYASIEACRPDVIAGNRGFCRQNPAWPGSYGQAEVPRRHAKRHSRPY